MNHKTDSTKSTDVNEIMNKPFSTSYCLSKELKKLEIDPDIKLALNEMNAKVVLPRKDSPNRNKANIYISSATHISGLYRICYLKIGESSIELSEYRGARGDRFSGFFNILINMLLKRDLIRNDDIKIRIPVKRLNALIECINIISSKAEKSQYILKETSLTYPRIHNSILYQLTISYFEEKIADATEGNSYTKENDHVISYDKNTVEACKNIDSLYKSLVENAEENYETNIQELKIIKEHLDMRMKKCESIGELLNEVKELDYKF